MNSPSFGTPTRQPGYRGGTVAKKLDCVKHVILCNLSFGPFSDRKKLKREGYCRLSLN
jgi:hypothetical protein